MSGAMRKITPRTSQGKPPVLRGLQDRVAVERERRKAGQSAAARAAVRPGRPADDANDGRAARPVLEHRAAGIPSAGAKPVAGALRERIDQANLQRPGLAGPDQPAHPNAPAPGPLPPDA